MATATSAAGQPSGSSQVSTAVPCCSKDQEDNSPNSDDVPLISLAPKLVCLRTGVMILHMRHKQRLVFYALLNAYMCVCVHMLLRLTDLQESSLVLLRELRNQKDREYIEVLRKRVTLL